MFSKVIFPLLFIFVSVGFVTLASAEELSIVGNSANSSNTITVNSGSTVNTTQNNSSNINNYIDATAKTGGNTSSYNQGDATIQSGDASVKVQVTNLLNSNIAKEDCCPSPTLTPKPTEAKPAPTSPVSTPPPTTTSAPGQPAPSAPSPSGNGGVGGPGQVLGLPVTSSSSKYSSYPTLIGLVCLAAAVLVTKSSLAS